MTLDLLERPKFMRVPAREAAAARPTNVRVATEADEPALLDFLLLLGLENAMAPVNEKRVAEVIRTATRRQGSVIGVIEEDQRIAASIGLTMGHWWYSDEWHCEELWSAVHPKYRVGDRAYARDLINFAKWWAERLEMDLLLGVLSTKRTEAKVRLYGRHIKQAGALFLHRIDRG